MRFTTEMSKIVKLPPVTDCLKLLRHHEAVTHYTALSVAGYFSDLLSRLWFWRSLTLETLRWPPFRRCFNCMRLWM